MEPDWNAFEHHVAAIAARQLAQRGVNVPDDALARFAARLRQMVATRGLPRPLAPGELGTPGGMSEAECAPLVAEVMAGIEQPELVDPARQLIKACFYPEFTICRDSYREVARDGTCRRQERSRVLSRVGGAHCVDCPHWVALSPDQHRALLEREWRGDRAELAAHRSEFLPEDFRQLRRWLHATARGG